MWNDNDDDLPMDANAGHDNNDKMDFLDSNYDDRNLRMDDWCLTYVQLILNTW